MLNRYTPLRPSPLPRRTKPMRRSRINPVSAKRKAEQPERRRCLAEVRKRSHGRCEAMCSPDCQGVMVDGHEIVRRGKQGSIIDPANVIAVCRMCHIWIGESPERAHALGLHVWSWEAQQ